MDGKGNINFNAPKNFIITAGENFNLSAGKEVSVSAGTNITNSAGKNILTTAGNDISITAAGDYRENSNNKTEIIENKHLIGSKEATHFAEKVNIFSTVENLHLESTKKTVEINSAEKSNFF